MIGLGNTTQNASISFSQRGDTTVQGSYSLAGGVQLAGDVTTNGAANIGLNYNPTGEGPRRDWNFSLMYDMAGTGLSGSIGYTDPGSNLGLTSTFNQDGMSTSAELTGVGIATNGPNGFQLDEINFAEQNINAAQDRTQDDQNPKGIGSEDSPPNENDFFDDMTNAGQALAGLLAGGAAVVTGLFGGSPIPAAGGAATPAPSASETVVLERDRRREEDDNSDVADHQDLDRNNDTPGSDLANSDSMDQMNPSLDNDYENGSDSENPRSALLDPPTSVDNDISTGQGAFQAPVESTQVTMGYDPGEGEKGGGEGDQGYDDFQTADGVRSRSTNEYKDKLPLKINEIESAALVKSREIQEKIDDSQTTTAQRKELKKQLVAIKVEKNNLIKQAKIQALEPIPNTKDILTKIEERPLNAEARNSKLVELQSNAIELEKKIEQQIKEAEAIDIKDPTVKEYIKSLKEQQILAKITYRLNEVRIRRLESNPLPPTTAGRELEFSEPTSLKYGIRVPSETQLNNMFTLAEAYKAKDNNPEFKKITDSVNSKIESLSEVQVYRKAQDAVSERMRIYNDYAEAYAREGLAPKDVTTLLKEKYVIFVKPAQAEFEKTRLAGEKALASKDIEIKRAWLEKNGVTAKDLDNDMILKMDATLGNKSTSTTQMNHYIAEWNKAGYLKESDKFVTITDQKAEAIILKPGDKQGELSEVTTTVRNPDGTEKLITTRWPIDVSSRGLNITSPLDRDGRTLPVTDPTKKSIHDGSDVGKVPVGTPYGSVAGSMDTPGRVIYVSPDIDSSFATMTDGGKGYGANVKIEYQLPDGRLVHVTYAHLSNINVQIDQPVIQGDLIGLSGNSGRSERPHLHYKIEVKQPNGNGFQLVDPSTFDWGSSK
ncbi:M23 family metallopeptidase [Leptospira bandrabouensis]|uniref:M23 family metallopeptidase n=1 Tax=Leptospira bandrabouensis TaxID=2484903 RepID=UPI001EE8652F|nr:M23 family metallopeptidase [Leptospira bandrabouensis]MCG6144510.1 peptidoglycan DD-metalloendopeptidase family protein [Leptospira bandrabouensis]MCG6160171.1 peptidoglycan DD-metalloendopeptidase family protein [Leptospira bandrabouensis]MCG6164104.1 peptidoglycan DD-metalloendopeptidase family protein [Leptospira bandrabouensis]